MPASDGVQTGWTLDFDDERDEGIVRASFGGISIWTSTDSGLTWTGIASDGDPGRSPSHGRGPSNSGSSPTQYPEGNDQ